ncbi:hypothetical protein PIB30_013853 [Stylosanthes scabra]|uniref:Uncharacterized protein n=1 Tax=Stylosanthes scabra TaxID=79078 RepID=A0ABU6T690_9FABA|nr:hypothetical protein [Stylosanthes scabra]
MRVVVPLEIQSFAALVNKCQVIEDCNRRMTGGEFRRGGFQGRGRGGMLAPRGQNFNSGEKCTRFMLFSAGVSGDNLEIDQIPVVQEFAEVFPEDIPEFPPQREV